MPRLERAVATLRLSGEELVPAEVSALLGCEPTQAFAKGQALSSTTQTPVRIAKFGLWRLCAADTEPEDTDTQIAELLGRVTQDLGVWQELSRRFKVELFCGWFMGASNDGVAISPEALLALGERSVELSLDIYAPEQDA